MPRPTTLLLLAVGSTLGLTTILHAGTDAPATAGEHGADADLPITHITMYRSGVASFERECKLTGDKTIPLRFETTQIDDILKSLVLLDSGGGTIPSVGFPSNVPLGRRLSGFQVDLSRATSVEDIFRALRGAAVKVQTPDGEVSGTILTVEKRDSAVPTGTGTTGGSGAAVLVETYVSLVTPTGIRAFPIARIGSFSFADAELNQEIQRALGAVSDQRTDRTKTVELNFKGAASRGVFVGYVCEAPVWKTSYRLVLSDEPTSPEDKAKKPIMQGWAIVENTTDNDWKNVRLSLASGRPVSFTMPLYQPLFAARPSLPVPAVAGLSPRMYEEASNIDRDMLDASQMQLKDETPASAAAAPSLARSAPKSEIGGAANGRPPLLGDVPLAKLAAQQAAATGDTVGEQFLFNVSEPVTIDRQRSAMLPILNAPVSARRVSIYNPNDGGKNPMRGAELTNDSKLELMPGPIAIYDDGAYAGDAEIPHTARNAKQLLAYAADLGVIATTKIDTDQTVSRVAFSHGTLVQKLVSVTTRSYGFENRDSDKGRTIVVEHPRTIGWDLVEPKRPDETTDSLYRFDLKLDPGKPGALKVVERRLMDQVIAVENFPVDNMMLYASQHKASDAVVAAFKKASQMHADIASTRAEIAKIDAERTEIGQEQDRIRKNMASVDRNSDLHTRYVTKLNEQETKLEGNQTRKEDLEKTLKTQEAALSDFLRDLNLE